MPPRFRSVLSVLTGLVAGVFVIAAIESAGSVLVPFPPQMPPNSLEPMRLAILKFRNAVYLVELVAEALGTFAGAWTAACRTERSPRLHSLAVLLLLLLAGIANMLVYPHPLWLWVCGITAVLVAGAAAGRLVPGR